jgi:hypothetical protein
MLKMEAQLLNKTLNVEQSSDVQAGRSRATWLLHAEK